MTIVRWEPLRELSSLQSEMNRLFDGLFEPDRTTGQNAARRWVPPMDLVETDEHFVLRADLPGMNQEDVKIELDDNVLTLSGERRAEHETRQEGFYRVERAFGAFARSLTLPKGIDPEAVSASFDRGVLEVRIPKPEQAKPRRISISGREQSTGNGQAAHIEGTSSPA